MRRHRAARRGIASLEFVMAFPVLLLMAVLIYRLAQWQLAKARATLDARVQAADERTGRRSAEPPPFPQNEGLRQGVNPKAGTSGLADQSATRPFNRRPLAGPTRVPGRYSVLVGTWDHRGMVFKDHDPLQPFDDRAWRMIGNAERVWLPVLDMSKLDAKSLADQFWTRAASSLMSLGNPSVKDILEIENLLKNPKEALAKLATGLLRAPVDLVRLEELLRDANKRNQALQGLAKLKDAPAMLNKLKDAVRQANPTGPRPSDSDD